MDAGKRPFGIPAPADRAKFFTITWTNSNPCGAFEFSDTTGYWKHYPKNSPKDNQCTHTDNYWQSPHDGTITITVRDALGKELKSTYTGGTRAGTGEGGGTVNHP